MTKQVNLLDYSEKVKNFSIPSDDAKELITTLSDSAFDALVGAYFRFQLTGDEECYKGKQQALWKILVAKKKKYFLNKYVKKTSVEPPKTQQNTEKTEKKEENKTLKEYYRSIGVNKKI